MVSSILKQAAEILRKRKESRRWQRVFLCLAVVAAAATVTILMTTGQALTREEKVLECQFEVHEHSQDCYDEEGNLVCGYADYVIHEHNDDCYDAEGKLVCELPETELHEHEESCYEEQEVLACAEAKKSQEDTKPETEKDSGESGSEENNGGAGESLICGKEEHSHADDDGTEKSLTCGESEHSHEDDCYDEEGSLTCGEEEHSHNDDCYEEAAVSCDKEEHTHSSECYGTKERDSGDDAEVAGAEKDSADNEESGDENGSSDSTDTAEGESGSSEDVDSAEAEGEAVDGHVHTEECYVMEQVLICGETDQGLHIHVKKSVEEGGCYEESAFDEESGEFIEGSRPVCGLLQLEEHVHTEKCFKTKETEVPASEKEFTGELDSGRIRVVVSYSEDAGIPEDAELLVKQITKKSNKDLFEKRTGDAGELTDWPEAAEKQIYSVGFYDGDAEVEPQEAVDIDFTLYQEEIAEENLLGIIGFDGDDGEVLEDAETAEAEDGFGITLTGVSAGEFLFAFDGLDGTFRKEFSGEYADGTFRVIATYGRDAEIPKDAQLIVEAITEETNEKDYREKTDTAKELAGYQEASAEMLFDIGFFVKGKEIEPQATVAIEFQLYKNGIEAGEPVTVIHFGGGEAELLESTNMSKNEDGSLSTSFESDSFSPFMLVVGGGEERIVGLISGERKVYEEADRDSAFYNLSDYKPTPEEPVRIELLESLTDEKGEDWYRYRGLTDDAALKKILDDYPYIPAKSVVKAEKYVKQTLTAVDEDGVKIAVKGFLPDDAELSVDRIRDPEIADVVEVIEADLPGEDIGDFRLVYDMGIGTEEILPWAVTVTVSNFDLYYYEYDNLASWIYQVYQKEDARVEKSEAETKKEGAVEFQTDEFSVFYVAMALIEGREEFHNSLVEQGDPEELTWDFEEEAEEIELEVMPSRMRAARKRAGETSATQITSKNGSGNSQDGVTVNKTIAGTEQENVFDITLEVKTTENIKEIYGDPDMAVVIVMDISNTMSSKMSDGKSRYDAAMDAASAFIGQFKDACQSNSRSKIGFVAFNTNSSQIFRMQQCCTDNQVNTLRSTMKTGTKEIIDSYTRDKNGDVDDYRRFTNVEAGLKRAQDMLDRETNKNKYIVFLSDGFPTTYIKEGYDGYDPCTPNGSTVGKSGVFYDSIRKKYCLYGTNYSDKAAIKARERATIIKKSGISVFSVGVDIGGQTIQKYLNSDADKKYATVDRTTTSYEIGGASDLNAYKNWLGNKIGSGYYYDSTNAAGLATAFNEIFNEIKRIVEGSSQSVWVVEDPMPTLNGTAGNDKVGFIGFYNKDNALIAGNQHLELIGAYGKGKENTVNCTSNKITWDLKNSGFTSNKSGNVTTYTYTLKYRVRLENEESGFAEEKSYSTNDRTTLTYQTITTTGGSSVISDAKKVDFPIPSVKGYLSELTFQKVDRSDHPIQGAEFTLKHDTDNCNVCRGDKTPVSIGEVKKTSDGDGKVTFTDIPSGHQYILEESVVPDGHYSYGEKYAVKVAYDEQTVTVTNITTGSPVPAEWSKKVVNGTIFKLPKTGGSGTSDYVKAGILLMLLATIFCSGYYRRKNMKRG